MTIDELGNNKKAMTLAVTFIWLVHISAVIGIFLGYREWFITKTPLNLLLLVLVLIVFNPLTSKTSLGLFGLIFLGGYISEVIGVNTGLLFGDYQYGNNLGLKIAGVPLLIGINWAVLVVTTAEISKRFGSNIWLKAAIAAGLMVFLDAFIEPLAPTLDFWTWTYGHPPLFNYITWFIIAYGLILLYLKAKINGNRSVALHIFLSQLFFFCLLNIERIL
jgi:putative membrane protein